MKHTRQQEGAASRVGRGERHHDISPMIRSLGGAEQTACRLAPSWRNRVILLPLLVVEVKHQQRYSNTLVFLSTLRLRVYVIVFRAGVMEEKVNRGKYWVVGGGELERHLEPEKKEKCRSLPWWNNHRYVHVRIPRVRSECTRRNLLQKFI